MTVGPPYSYSKDFSDGATFVAGALTGRRAFRIARTGSTLHPGVTLTGCVKTDFEWSTTEVNVARCIPYPAWEALSSHQIASINCRCGFWSYLAETPDTLTYRNMFENAIGVEGIIFGFGFTTAGTLGFRCSKARIKALVVPAEDSCTEDQLDLLTDAMAKYADTSGFRWYGTMEAALADFPLSKATKYGIAPKSDGEVA